jgi:hypothetical protein
MVSGFESLPPSQSDNSSSSSHAFRLGGQPNALIIGKPETARTELLSKNAILRLKIVNHLALLLVDPGGQGDEQKS